MGPAQREQLQVGRGSVFWRRAHLAPAGGMFTSQRAVCMRRTHTCHTRAVHPGRHRGGLGAHGGRCPQQDRGAGARLVLLPGAWARGSRLLGHTLPCPHTPPALAHVWCQVRELLNAGVYETEELLKGGWVDGALRQAEAAALLSSNQPAWATAAGPEPTSRLLAAVRALWLWRWWGFSPRLRRPQVRGRVAAGPQEAPGHPRGQDRQEAAQKGARRVLVCNVCDALMAVHRPG